MLLYSKANTNNDEQKDLLKWKADEITKKTLLYSNTNSKSSLYGDRMYSGVVYYSSFDAAAKDTALKNGLPVFNITDCNELLKSHYGIQDPSDIIYMTNKVDATMNMDKYNSYKLSAFNSQTKDKLDIDLCSNMNVNIELPVTENVEVNLTAYRRMKQDGFDTFDPNDLAFNDICATNPVEQMNVDTTVNWRRQNLFPSRIPLCVGMNCTYHGITDNDYVNCKCSGLNSNNDVTLKMVEYQMKNTTSFNAGVMLCYQSILQVFIY
jgi:hypothetical protein